MVTDTMTPRPKVLARTPYRVQPYDNQREEAQAKGTYADAIKRLQQYDNHRKETHVEGTYADAIHNSHMIPDARRHRPKVITLMPYRMQPI